MKNPFGDCEGCKERREAMMRAGRKMADWVKHRVGPPPINTAVDSPKLPPIDRPALKRKTKSSA